MTGTTIDRSRRASLARAMPFTAFVALGVPGMLVSCGIFPSTCTPIASVPYVISRPGEYCLARDLSFAGTEGSAILVSADGVTVDLAGFTLSGTAGPSTHAFGLSGHARRTVTVRNGTITGFLYGVLLSDEEKTGWSVGGGHVLRDLRLPANYFRGARAEGRQVVVERCQVKSTGGTTVFGDRPYSFGLELYGPGARIVGNLVEDTFAGPGGEAVGISITDNAEGDLVIDNVVRDAVLATRYNSFGVWIGGGNSKVFLLDNRFVNLKYGIRFSGNSAGAARGNVAVGCTTGVTDAGHGDNPMTFDWGGNLWQPPVR